MKLLKNLLRIAIVTIVFLYLSRIFFEFEDKVDEKNGIYLNNNVEFGGIVTDLKVSSNHDFGVITLKIAKSNLFIFNQLSPANKTMLYPYRIQNGIAEIYHSVPGGMSVGDSVYLNSKELLIKYFYVKENRQYTGRLRMVNSGRDANFVNENSTLK